MAPPIGDLVALCLRQAGDPYRFGAEAPLEDEDPDAFDCSELIEWAAGRLGVRFPDGSWYQARACRNAGQLIDVQAGVDTQGALLFRFSSDPFDGGRPRDAHVAVSLGNGSTIEARGARWGIGSWGARDRRWTHAGLIPGFTYGAPPTPAPAPAPATSRKVERVEGADGPPWPGRLFVHPPIMRGDDVRTWQQMMAARGWRIDVDGAYGPASERVCRSFQREKGLRVDGVVGADTWRATWAAPVT